MFRIRIKRYAKLIPLAFVLALFIPVSAASAATRSCKPSAIEREQNGVKSITTNTSCATAVELASSTSLPRGSFRAAGRTWIGYTTGKGKNFKYVYRTQTLTPSLIVTVGF